MSGNPSKAHEIIQSNDFKNLVRKRIVVSTVLTLVMLFFYFGFILSIAFFPQFLSIKIGPTLTLGLPIGIGLILFAWLLTGVYTRWANHSYDKTVRELRNRLFQK